MRQAAKISRQQCRKRVFILLICTSILLGCMTGCSTSTYSGEPSYADYLYERTYKTGIIAEHLIRPLIPPRYNRDEVIVVTSYVKLANFTETSNFGLVMGEQMLSRLASFGFRVRETRIKDVFYQGKNGEFVLTREFARLAHEMDADLVLIGTYMETRQHVLLNTRLVDFKNNEIISSYDCQVPKTEDILDLLSK